MIDKIKRLRELYGKFNTPNFCPYAKQEMQELEKELLGIDIKGYLISYVEMLQQEIKNLRKELDQEKCPHSVDVLGVCEWCGAGAEPEHLDI